ncbi:hypothetical protein [Halomontanus rarus]|uniref:hypothetical protein n=1 Tax=Halomontanus rarus TaxID=3034020 RepID=UPI00293BBC7D|nr:hypothetical protein [Halovivax sp. KZCA124]
MSDTSDREDEFVAEVDRTNGQIEIGFAPQKEYHFYFNLGSLGDLVVRGIDWAIEKIDEEVE